MGRIGKGNSKDRKSKDRGISGRSENRFRGRTRSNLVPDIVEKVIFKIENSLQNNIKLKKTKDHVYDEDIDGPHHFSKLPITVLNPRNTN
jgi:hypothetical protein